MDAYPKCDLHRADFPAEAFARPLDCPRCGGKIPASAAVTFEGADYVRFFCGRDCLAGWCERMHRVRHSR